MSFHFPAQDVVVKSKVIHPPLTGVESSLGQFFGSKALSDVTLVCVEDGKEFPAHRLVLSSKYSTFKNQHFIIGCTLNFVIFSGKSSILQNVSNKND
jgi:hypothetical protein